LLVEDVTAKHRNEPFPPPFWSYLKPQRFRAHDMPRPTRLFPVQPRSPPGVSRWRAKPRWRGATDDGDDGWLEEWMVGYPSIARTLN
jgi:hypothetical protein